MSFEREHLGAKVTANMQNLLRCVASAVAYNGVGGYNGVGTCVHTAYGEYNGEESDEEREKEFADINENAPRARRVINVSATGCRGACQNLCP